MKNTFTAAQKLNKEPKRNKNSTLKQDMDLTNDLYKRCQTILSEKKGNNIGKINKIELALFKT